MNEDENALLQLRWAVQALAAAPSDQPRLYPEFACTACELLLDFENWNQATIWRTSLALTGTQTSALQSIATYIDGMQPTPCFANEVLKRDDWCRLRELAIECISQFAWKRELPPRQRGVFVKG